MRDVVAWHDGSSTATILLLGEPDGCVIWGSRAAAAATAYHWDGMQVIPAGGWLQIINDLACLVRVSGYELGSG